MKNKNSVVLISSITAICVLIVCNKSCANTAKEGIYLCINVIIPSLLPFIYLSSILTSFALTTPIKLMEPLCKLFRIPEHCGHILIMSLLGGYPMGATAIEQSCAAGQLSRSDAHRMLAYCNNAGPSFIFGMIGSLFPNLTAPLLLWLIHIISAWCTGQLIQHQHTSKQPLAEHKAPMKKASLYYSMRVMGSICCWVILFKILINIVITPFAQYLPPAIYAFSCGVLELSNGCLALHTVESTAVRFVLASALLALGGLCVCMQTACVSGSLGLKTYFLGKVMQCFLSILLAIPIAAVLYSPVWDVGLIGTVIFALLCGSVLIAIFLRKSCSILIKDRL